jgi:hypothetical protein
MSALGMPQIPSSQLQICIAPVLSIVLPTASSLSRPLVHCKYYDPPGVSKTPNDGSVSQPASPVHRCTVLQVLAGVQIAQEPWGLVHHHSFSCALPGTAVYTSSKLPLHQVCQPASTICLGIEANASTHWVFDSPKTRVLGPKLTVFMGWGSLYTLPPQPVKTVANDISL